MKQLWKECGRKKRLRTLEKKLKYIRHQIQTFKLHLSWTEGTWKKNLKMLASSSSQPVGLKQ